MANFDKESCICKDLCDKYNTDECSALCEGYWYSSFVGERSNIPPKFKRYTPMIIPNTDKIAFKTLSVIQDDIYRFVYEGRNLYIHSYNTGNGKTTWATNLMLAYFTNIKDWCGKTIRGVFVHVPMFLMQCKNTMSTPDPNFEQFKEAIRIADVVIWDDIATSKLSAYDNSVLYAYIQERLLSGKTNIYTGTADKKQMEYMLDSNLTSRIWSNLFAVTFNSEAYKSNDFFTNS